MLLSTSRIISRRLLLTQLLTRRIFTPITIRTMSSSDSAFKLLISSFDALKVVDVNTSAATPTLTLYDSSTIAGTNTIANHLASLIPQFKDAAYTDAEQAEIDQWLTLSAASPIPEATLDQLEKTLKFRTTILGEKPSVADVVVFTRVKDIVADWSDEQRTGENGRRHITRWVDFVQNSRELGLKVPEEDKVKIDADKVLFKPKPEVAPKKEKKDAAAPTVEGAVAKVKEVAGKAVKGAKEAGKKVAEAAKAAAAAGQKTQKKEKKEKPKREPAPPKPGR